MTKIGFIGQGWIGRHYADNFEDRLYEVVRYSLEEPYVNNKEQLQECEIVFVAVPTPTTPEGFSYEPVKDALRNLKKGTTVVIKSTLYPGTTNVLQLEFPHLYLIHSPEFLREAHAAEDAAKPDRNIVGIPEDNQDFRSRASSVMNVLPDAPYNRIMSARDAETVKYASNCFLYSKVVFMNVLYDLVTSGGGDWEVFRDALINDTRIGGSHTMPIHKSTHDNGSTSEKRGAGGHCFIKDFEAFRNWSKESLPDNKETHELLKQMITYNNNLLVKSEKDLELLKGVYGETLKPE